MPPRVQAAQRVLCPSDAQFLHSLQHVQLAKHAQTPTTDAHLQHQDGGRQVMRASVVYDKIIAWLLRYCMV